LAFRLPNHAPAPEIIVPTSNAQVNDKLQWLAMNRPHTMRRLEQHIESIIQHHRTRPAAMLFNLTGQLEYRALTVNDPDVLLASPDNRLGRRMHDIMPHALMDVFDRCLHTARATKTASTYRFPVRDQPYEGTILITTPDTIIVKIAKLLPALAASVYI
jgi:hypothetical protein